MDEAKKKAKPGEMPLRFTPDKDKVERTTLVLCVRLSLEEVELLKRYSRARGEDNWIKVAEGMAQQEVTDQLDYYKVWGDAAIVDISDPNP